MFDNAKDRDRERDFSPQRAFSPNYTARGGIGAMVPRMCQTGYVTEYAACGFALFRAMPDPWGGQNWARAAEVIADERAYLASVRS